MRAPSSAAARAMSVHHAVATGEASAKRAKCPTAPRKRRPRPPGGGGQLRKLPGSSPRAATAMAQGRHDDGSSQRAQPPEQRHARSLVGPAGVLGGCGNRSGPTRGRNPRRGFLHAGPAGGPTRQNCAGALSFSCSAHPNPSPATGFWRAYPPRGAAACRSARAEPRSAFFKQSHADDLQGGAVYAHLQAQRRGSMAVRRCARRTVLGWPALGRAEDTCGNLLRSTLCAARALEKRRHNSELPVLFGLSDASRNVSPACVRRVVPVSGARGRVQATGRACP